MSGTDSGKKFHFGTKNPFNTIYHTVLSPLGVERDDDIRWFVRGTRKESNVPAKWNVRRLNRSQRDGVRYLYAHLRGSVKGKLFRYYIKIITSFQYFLHV